MLNRDDGFSIVELLVAMVVFGLVIAASSNAFIGLTDQFKQQSKISETLLQDIIGFEILRRDVEHAGYGIPWTIPGAVGYTESTNPTASLYNDVPPNAPRALVSGNGAGVGGSDYLVVKSITVATQVNIAGVNVSQNWTRLGAGGFTLNGLSGRNFMNTDNVIVINPGTTGANQRTLVESVGSYATTWGNTVNYEPTGLSTNIVYGVDPNNVRMPFNRADYYISMIDVPARCEPSTGVLVKAEILHDATGTPSEMPLIDCVGDMQVVYALDNDEDEDFVVGTGIPPDAFTNTLAGLTVQQIRNRVKEVSIYVLAHEGQIDMDYTYNGLDPVTVGPNPILGSNFAVPSVNYRWQLHTLTVRPQTLR